MAIIKRESTADAIAARKKRIRTLEEEMLWRQLGPIFEAAYTREEITNIVVNDDDTIRSKSYRESEYRIIGEMSADNCEGAITTLASMMSANESLEDTYYLQGTYPGDGSRIEAILPPVTRRAILVWRKLTKLKLTLDDYVTSKQLSKEAAQFLRWAAKSRKTIAIGGGGDAGKTTFLNAYLREVAKCGDRCVIFQDTDEIDFDGHAVRLFSQDKPGQREVTMGELLKRFLRLSGKRPIVSEIRDGETMCATMRLGNTGSPGGAFTLHADSAADIYHRVVDFHREVRQEPLKNRIVKTIPIAVYMEAVDGVPTIREIAQAKSWTGDDPELEIVA